MANELMINDRKDEPPSLRCGRVPGSKREAEKESGSSMILWLLWLWLLLR